MKLKVSDLDYLGTIAQFNFGFVSHVIHNTIEEFILGSR